MDMLFQTFTYLVFILFDFCCCLQADRHALENDKAGIREELLRVEQEKMELETEKAGQNTTIEISENNIEQLKTEIQYLSKEKADITDSLNAVSIVCGFEARNQGYYASVAGSLWRRVHR